MEATDWEEVIKKWELSIGESGLQHQGSRIPGTG